MTFDEWVDVFLIGHTEIDVKELRLAYEAGWNACRDTWGGLDYDESLKYHYDGCIKDDI